MGSYVFKWEHPEASEVYVTGTFDDWKKSEKLQQVGDHFEKTVSLPDASEKIYYKFVVDGDWVTDHTAPKETDHEGNVNNVLTPESITASAAPASAAVMNSAAPASTTAALAASAPLENQAPEQPADLPGAFPETPSTDPDKGDFGVKPMPAAEGAVNPVKLAPGEKIPDSLAGEKTTSHVKLDQESYEKSDSLPGGAAMFSSAAAGSTTAALAAGAPLETKVPEVVKESQEKAHVGPGASGVSEEVQDKAQVEEELKQKVKEAPSTSEGTAPGGTDKTEGSVTPGEAGASIAAAVTAAGGAAVAGAYAAKDVVADQATNAAATAQTSATEAATKLPESVKNKLPASVQDAVGATEKEGTREEVSPEVPTEVKAAIAEANKDPEGAANTAAVEAKKAVEAELLKEHKPVEGSGPDESSAKPETAPAAEGASQAAATPPKTQPKEDASSTPTSSNTPESPATTDKKKKNRLSAFFGKIKSKASK